ncbi:MAG TPA: transketolase, partial [Pseudomonadales bacterium]|nr:transketolase [Pseudomonadales bacterium]
ASLAARFNKEKDGVVHRIVDHRTWVFVGDGCLMEGISHEAASLAGTLGLSRLTCIYDDNGISIDGEIKGWFTDDTPKRFEAYGWNVIPNVDGHDRDALVAAFDAAIAETHRPTLICCKTEIGFGAPNKGGTAATHGSALGEEEVAATREALGWQYPPFEIPDDIYAAWDCRQKGSQLEHAWQQQFAEYAAEFPDLALEFERRMDKALPSEWHGLMDRLLAEADEKAENLASRNASGNVIREMAAVLPEIIGGSADLSGSNCTHWPEAAMFSRENPGGNYVYYGVREFGMTAIQNGMGLHGGILPFAGTFLIFMEYARNAVRMSALMGVREVLVYSHDSIGQGEDGPTHQPVEQLANLRGTPNMSLWRPCDAVETVVAWRAAVERMDGPTALVFSRQSLVHQPRDATQLENIARGGYILREGDGEPAAIIIATGSEVSLATAAFDILLQEGVPVRVVSMPSVDRFEAQDDAYRESVLPAAMRKRVAVEAAHPDYWRKFVGLDGSIVGLPTFGASGPGKAVFEHFGFTAEAVAEAVRKMLRG